MTLFGPFRNFMSVFASYVLLYVTISAYTVYQNDNIPMWNIFRNVRRVHCFISQNNMMFHLVLYPPHPHLRQSIALFAVWFVLFHLCKQLKNSHHSRFFIWAIPWENLHIGRNFRFVFFLHKMFMLKMIVTLNVRVVWSLFTEIWRHKP